MAWIQSYQDLGRHPKTGRRARTLGISRPAAIGDVPFGYRWQLRENADGTTSRATDLPLEPVPEEAEVIREAFRGRVSGAGPFEVAQRLNARGFRPRSKQGNPVFTLSAAQSMLENDFYCGYVRHKGARRR